MNDQLSLDDITPDPSPLAAVPLLDLLDRVAEPVVADEVRRRLTVADTVCPCCARPLGDFNAPGTTGRNHPDTSRAAGEVKRGSERARVLLAVHWSANGRTADEIAEVTYGNPNQVGRGCANCTSVGTPPTCSATTVGPSPVRPGRVAKDGSTC